MIQEMIQNILVYVVIAAVLKGLVSHEGFQEIFRFVSGLILILLFASPLVSLFSSGSRWYEQLEENMFQMDKKQMMQELQMADGSFEDILVSECETEIRKQLVKLAEDAGQTPESVEVQIEYQGELPEVTGVEMVLGDGERENPAQEGEEARQASAGGVVQEIVIGGKIESGEGRRRTDGQTRAVKKKICREFDLSKEVVEVWKISGKGSVQD